MKHDRDAIDHSFGGTGIPTRHGDRSSSLRVDPALKPPRPWAEMLDTWAALLGTLCAVLLPAGVTGAAREEQGMVNAHRIASASELAALHLRAWRWALALPPCSEARKAAMTLGASAYWIERWRAAQEIGEVLAPLPRDAIIGQRAERDLRIAAWHIGDARGEEHARTLGIEPAIPPHERVYERAPGKATGPLEPPADVAIAILTDASRHDAAAAATLRGLAARGIDTPDVVQHLVDTLVASLPDGPWVLTSRDVEAFMLIASEDAT